LITIYDFIAVLGGFISFISIAPYKFTYIKFDQTIKRGNYAKF